MFPARGASTILTDEAGDVAAGSAGELVVKIYALKIRRLGWQPAIFWFAAATAPAPGDFDIRSYHQSKNRQY